MKKWFLCLVTVQVVLASGFVFEVEKKSASTVQKQIAGQRMAVKCAKSDIVKFGNDVLVEEGNTVYNAVSIGGDVTVNGKVLNDAVAVGGSIIIGPTAGIGRNAVSVGGTIKKYAGADVAGDLVEVNVRSVLSIKSLFAGLSLHKFFWKIKLMTFVGFLALALLVVAVMPKQIGAISSAVESVPAKSVFLGLAATMAIVPCALLLLVSIAGIMFIPLEIVIVIFAFLAGYIAVAQFIGKRITSILSKSGQSIVWETMIGVVVLFVAGFVPLLGWLVKSFVLLIGFGGVIAVLINRKSNPQTA